MNAILRPDKKLVDKQEEVDVQLDKFTVEHDSGLIGKTIRGSGIRTATRGLVVGIERNGVRILNPESDTIFEEGDVVWIVGEKKLLNSIS